MLLIRGKCAVFDLAMANRNKTALFTARWIRSLSGNFNKNGKNVMRFTNKYLAWAATAWIALGLAGCASVKPYYVDTSGGKIKSVAVYASFKNLVTNKPSDQRLSEALAKSVCKLVAEQGVKCETLLANLPAPPSIDSVASVSHLIILNARLDSKSISQRDVWNSCRYEIMNKCVGGLERMPSLPAYMTLTAEVVEKRESKTVYKITKPQSFPSSDVSEWDASAKPASALVKDLKDSGLL